VTVAAVGPGTARALEAAGLRVDLVGAGGAAELPARLPLAAGARVLFPCAEEARADLEQALSGRGLEVRRVAVYRTRAMTAPRLDPDCDARVYTSPSAVEAALTWERAHPGRGTALLALGRTTAAALEQAGLAPRRALCPDEAAELPLVELLAGELARLRAERDLQEATR
jgi:uroporphyrinogen-III synthase